ncbi:MAG: hypothetical protein HKN27_07315 [Silicimonas sp.]|nr:hypothetical protein [Silicimonas sp.]
MEAEDPPFRQQWLVAEDGGEIIGLTYSILLPVPPINAGVHGAPGLIMEDCTLAPSAPVGTAALLLAATEADLQEAGAKVLAASTSVGCTWGDPYAARGYEPLTLYLAKTGLRKLKLPELFEKRRTTTFRASSR